MADGFHIDGSGNLWIGSTSNTFDNNAPFYVETDGTIQASSGTIGGLELASTYIESSNYSSTNETGYRLQSDGNAQFYGTLIADSFQGTGGTIGGIVIDTTGIESSNYDASTNTGWRLDNSTGVIDAYDIDINLEESDDANSPSSTQSLNIGSGLIYYYSSELRLSAPQVSITDSSGTPGATSPSLTFTDGTYDEPGFYAQEDNANQLAEFYFTSGAHDIFHTRSGFNAIYFDATTIDVRSSVFRLYDSTGSPGEVLGKTANGMEWVEAGGSHADSDHTSFASSGHDHDGDYLDSDHTNAANPHDNYLQESDHNANNTAHSNFLSSADLSNYISNSNNIYNSVVDHTDITANQGGGSAHGLSLSGVNAAVLHVNDNSAHTNHNHNFALAEDPHGNGEHNEAYITNNNANAHHGNAYAAPHNGHAHSHNEYAANHNHPYLNENHNNQVGHHTHNAGVATDPHGNGDHNASFITNSNANAHHGNTYANFTHYHLNPLTHDSRLLTVNANSVPGLNVVQRMNPVTANFSEQYKNKVLDEPSSLVELNQKSYRLTYQDVKQALEDDGVDTTDVAMIIENVEYANELAPELDDNMKGLMDGEIDAILVQAIKDLSAKIDLLEDRIATLEG